MSLWQRLKSLFVPEAPAPAMPPRDAIAAAPAPAPTPTPAPAPAPLPSRPKRTWPETLRDVLCGVQGEILGAIPTVDVWIHGVPCRAGHSVSFYRSGQLASAILAQAHTCDGEDLPAGCVVGFGSDGRLQSWCSALEAPRVFTTLGVEGPCTVSLAAGTDVVVEHGKLRAATLRAETRVDIWEFPEDTHLTWGDSGGLSHAILPVPWTLHGVRWAAHETVVFLFGRIHEGWPADDGVFEGVPYQGGEVLRFDDAGHLVRCYLGAEVELSGVPCRAGTRVYLDGAGGLLEGTLSRDATLAGIPAAEGSVVHASRGAMVAVTPREDCEVDGVPCVAGSPVVLRADGRVRHATLSRAHRVAGFLAPRGSVLERHDHEAPSMLVMTDGHDPEGRPMAGWWTLRWDTHGALRWRLPSGAHSTPGAVALRSETTLDGLLAAAGSSVTLDEDCTLRALVIAGEQTVAGLPCLDRTRVHLDAQGRPQSVYLARDTVVQGVPCAGGSTLSAVMNDVERVYQETLRLHPDGTVAFATLSDDAVVDGVPLAKGHTVVRYANGRLQAGTLARSWTHPLGYVAAQGTLLGLFDDGAPNLLTLAEPFDAHAAGTVLRYASPGAPLQVEPAWVPLGAVTPLVP